MKYAISRRQRKTIIITCILLACVIILLDHTSFKLIAPIKSTATAASSDLAKYHQKTFTVIKVVDGDTLDIDIPDGKYNQTRIRLWGIDTPETKSPKYGQMYFGPQSDDFTTKLASQKKVTVYLDKDNNTRGKYNRLLAYIQLPDGRFLNELLLAEGFAFADLRFRHSFFNKYKQLENSARRAKKGLWKNVTQDQLPKWLQQKRPGLLKK